jgi:putative flippase GtrA
MAYCVGMIVAFVLMRTYVFHARDGAILAQSIKFLAVNLIAAVQTLVVSVALAKWALPAMGFAAHAEALGHLAGVCAPIITSYFGHRLLTFR